MAAVVHTLPSGGRDVGRAASLLARHGGELVQGLFGAAALCLVGVALGDAEQRVARRRVALRGHIEGHPVAALVILPVQRHDGRRERAPSPLDMLPVLDRLGPEFLHRDSEDAGRNIRL